MQNRINVLLVLMGDLVVLALKEKKKGLLKCAVIHLNSIDKWKHMYKNSYISQKYNFVYMLKNYHNISILQLMYLR